jgi:hypothetical protein
MDYSNIVIRIFDYLLRNDNDKINLMMRDYSQKNLILFFLLFRYTLTFVIFSAFPFFIFERTFILEYLSDSIYILIFEVLRNLVFFILILSNSIYLATIKIVDIRYERYDENSIYSDGKKYEFIYGKYLLALKKLKRSLSTPMLTYVAYTIIAFLFFYALSRSNSGININSLVTISLACLSTGYFLATKKAVEYSGRVDFLGYISNENELNGLTSKFWNKRLVLCNDPYYYIFDNNKGKYMKFQIFSKKTIDLMDNVYERYIDEKIRILKEWLAKEKEELVQKKKQASNNSKEGKEIIERLKKIDESLRKLSSEK